MATPKKIVVTAAETQETLEDKGAVVENEYETVKAAKERARYYVTAEYAKKCESTTVLGYARVTVDGVCVFDVFGKGSPE